MTIKVRVLGAAVAMAAVAVGLTACGGKDNDEPNRAGGANDFEAYLSCLSEHGVTVPQMTRPTDQPRPDPSRSAGDGQGGNQGNGQRGPGGPGGFLGEQAPDGVDQATWDAARTACESVRPTGRPGQDSGGGLNDSASAAYRTCLADHGVTASQGPGSTADPKVAAAVKACAALRPEAPRPQPTQSS